jgi:hypothetical protein
MLEVFRFVLGELPSCLAVCFTWPQVALTHHVFKEVYTPHPSALSTAPLSGL